MIHFGRPEAFLLGLLLVIVLRRRLLAGPLVTTIRVVLLLALLAALADPWIVGRATGRDLVLVVDRSRSMPPGGLDRAGELYELARESARPGDRIGVVTFGRDSVVEQAPRAGRPWQPPSRPVDGDATDLAGAIDAALAVIPSTRPGSLLVVSDGEATGLDPASAARQALRRGVRIDVVPLRRTGVFDLAVEEVALPPEVTEGEPFPVTVWVRSDREVEAPVVVRRDGTPIASGTTKLRRGLNAIRLKDRLIDAGVHAYDVEVGGDGDRVPENDRARAALRVTGPFRVLVVTPNGREDRLTRSLEAAGLVVVVSDAAGAPVDAASLDGFRAIVLEDVPLTDLPPGADAGLATWVRELGGGLLMTGGRSSFGPGGYYRSRIEEVLPVTMEVRQEQRRFHLAMSIALDRSGSMSMSAGTGTKMDLANLGTCAAIELLGPGDAVAVTAVDSSPHTVVPLTSVTDKVGLCNEVRRIESMGGGIFVEVALKQAASELRGASQGARHIVLFADAADAEEPGPYKTYVPALKAAGVTVSVIGLGSTRDSDAKLLEEIAALGGGRVFFAADAADLPRVFAQETIQVARSSINEEPAAVKVEPGIVAVGALSARDFPDVGGYSIAYLKPDATRGLVTLDEQAAPLLAFWQHGLGRSGTYLGVVDGELTGAVGAWEGYADFFATIVRWLAGTEASGDLYTDVTRRGHEGVLTVEVEHGQEAALAGLDARVVGPDGTARPLTLVRTDETRLEARFPLGADGAYRPVLARPNGEVLRLPPAALPYSPEFEPRVDPTEGTKTLGRIAKVAQGRVDPSASGLWEGSRTSRGATSILVPLLIASLVLLLAEIAIRRLRPNVKVPATLPKALTAKLGRWRKRAKTRREKGETKTPKESAEEAKATPEPAPPVKDDIVDVLERARRRKRR